MDLLTLLILIVAIVGLIILALFVIDKTFTGPMAEWAWVAKIIVGLIALILIVTVLLSISGGPNVLSYRIGK